MKRVLILLAVVIVGAAAPARAWCEATCVAPVEASDAHCPSHEPASDRTALSSTSVADCPTLDSARTSMSARLDAPATAAIVGAAPLQARTLAANSSTSPRTATTVFERCTPLRI